MKSTQEKIALIRCRSTQQPVTQGLTLINMEMIQDIGVIMYISKKLKIN